MIERRKARAVVGVSLLVLAGWYLGGWARQLDAGASDRGTPVSVRPEALQAPVRAMVPAPALIAAPPSTEAPDPRWRRDPSEWQGMLPLPLEWPCARDGSCSMARACVDGRCVPCAADKECMDGELCALGRCVHQERADCTSKNDRQEGELCILSDPTAPSLRGNAGTRAACLSPNGPSPFPIQEAFTPTGVAPPVTPAERVSELLQRQLEGG